MEHRDQTSRASFVCQNCQRTYTDLEADQLLDYATGQLVCIICRTEVQEEKSDDPKQDSRILLTRFNEQLEPLFTLLQEVENIKLAPEFSDPTPTETVNGKKINIVKSSKTADTGRSWSGETSKRAGFHVEGSVDVNISSGQQVEETQKAKEQPAWLADTSELIASKYSEADEPEVLDSMSTFNTMTDSSNLDHNKPKDSGVDNIMMLLQAHESKPETRKDNDSDSDGIEELSVIKSSSNPYSYNNSNDCTVLDDDDPQDQHGVVSMPLISVGSERIPINQVDQSIITRMTQQEKNLYINAYQEYMASVED